MYKIEIPRQIGQAIKEKRLEKGFTQEQLAIFSNTSRSLIYRLEKGTTNGISLEKLFDVLRILGLEFAIVDLDGTPENVQHNTMNSDIPTIPDTHRNRRGGKRKPSTHTHNNSASKNDSSRNSRAQREKELKAIQNIKALNAQMNSKG